MSSLFLLVPLASYRTPFYPTPCDMAKRRRPPARPPKKKARRQDMPVYGSAADPIDPGPPPLASKQSSRVLTDTMAKPVASIEQGLEQENINANTKTITGSRFRLRARKLVGLGMCVLACLGLLFPPQAGVQQSDIMQNSTRACLRLNMNS